MTAKNWNYKWLSIVLLFLVFIGFGGCGSSEDEKALMKASESGDSAEVKRLIDKKVDVDQRCRKGNRPFTDKHAQEPGAMPT